MIDSGRKDGIKDPAFLRKVSEFKIWLESLPLVDKTVDLVDIIYQMNQHLNAGDESYRIIPNSHKEVAELLFLYTMSPQGMDINNRMSLDQDALRMSVLWTVQESKDWGDLVSQIEAKGKEMGLTIAVTGKTNLFQQMMGYVVTTFFQSIVMASFLVCLLMIALFRSLKIGLISLIPNLLPLVYGGAFPFKNFNGYESKYRNALVVSVCLGIVVDDTIHFLLIIVPIQKVGFQKT